MGRIFKDIEVSGDKGSVKVRALFDSGAARSFIREDKASAVAAIMKLPTPMQFRLGDGKTKLTVDKACAAQFPLSGVNVVFTFYVTPNLNQEMIVGADAMQQWKMVLVPEQEDVRIDLSALEFEL